MKMKPKFIVFPMALFLLLTCASCSFADQIEEALYVKTLYVNGTLVTPIGAMNTTGNTSSNLVFSESPTIANATLTGNVTIPKYYGEVYLSETSIVTANSVSVVDGTITAGDVTKTRYADQDYFTVQETGAFKINVTFTGMSFDPYKIGIVGRYEGNAAHSVEAEIYNYSTKAFDNLVATTKDFPSVTSDALYRWVYPIDSSNYRSNGESIFRIDHTSAASSSHHFYLDKIELHQKTVHLTTAGTWYQVAGLSTGLSNGTTVNSTAIVINTSGVYSLDATSSWSGTPSSVFYIHPFVNGVEVETIGTRKRMDINGDMATTAMSGLVNLAAGDVVTLKASTDTNNSCISIQYLNLRVMLI